MCGQLEPISWPPGCSCSIVTRALNQILWLVAHQKWRPPVPEGCPPALADLMQRCWQDDPHARWGEGGGRGRRVMHQARMHGNTTV